MAHKCPVAKNGNRICSIHRHPTRTIRYLFERLIVDEYTRQELKAYHEQVKSAMLDRDERHA
jgi:hypothetical protein